MNKKEDIILSNAINLSQNFYMCVFLQFVFFEHITIFPREYAGTRKYADSKVSHSFDENR